MIGRRDLLTSLGGDVTWPLAARAQQQALPVVGFTHSAAAGQAVDLVAAIRAGLGDSGFVEGRNVAIEYRWAEGHYDRLREFTAELVRDHVAVLIAGDVPAAAAAQATSKTVPIVFLSGLDPIKAGLVQSFARPGGNLTGVYLALAGLAAKRLGVLRELSPRVAMTGVLLNPSNPNFDTQVQDVREAARAINLPVTILNATNTADLDGAFEALTLRADAAMLVGADPFFFSRRDQIVALAATRAIPAIYELREFVTVGGLISYGPSLARGYRQVGDYADLPVQQPAEFELVINLKTAKALGLTVPTNLLAGADEIIE